MAIRQKRGTSVLTANSSAHTPASSAAQTTEPRSRVRLRGMVGIGPDGHPATANPSYELLR